MILRGPIRQRSLALVSAQDIQCIVQNLLLKLRAYLLYLLYHIYSSYETLIIYPYKLNLPLKSHFTWI